MPFSILQNLQPNANVERARYLVRKGLTPTAIDNGTIKKWYKFLKKYQNLAAENLEGLYKEYPEIYSAHEINNSNLDYKWYIEALITANEDPTKIADYLGLTPDIVKAYELGYYNVRRHLDKEGYVLCNILGSSHLKGVDPYNPDIFWKLISYSTKDIGSEGIYAWWSVSSNTPGYIEESFKKMYLKQREKLRLHALHSIKANQYNSMEILEADTNMLRLEHERAMESGQAAMIGSEQEKMGALMSCIRWTVGKYSPQLAKSLPADEMPPLGTGALTIGKPDLNDVQFDTYPSEPEQEETEQDLI